MMVHHRMAILPSSSFTLFPCFPNILIDRSVTSPPSLFSRTSQYFVFNLRICFVSHRYNPSRNPNSVFVLL